ncbi:MAG: glycosyltransferase [Chloroflexi bacterium]|nr:glycosyltransferase [Chloroflexota bacterium]
MNNTPLVSIVTPSYNQADFLEATIQSVLGQDYTQIEYILVDGGSTDGSLDIIKAYEDKFAYWVSEADSGQTEAVNKGFGLANGEILAWLNSDDTYQPGAVAEAVAYLLANPEIGMVYGDANYIDERGREIGRFPARQTDYRRLRRGYVHIPQQAAFWRAELWNQAGPLDPSYSYAMDYDLWVRLARISKLQYHRRVWANFRLHGSSKTMAGDEGFWPEMLRIHRRDGGGWFSMIVFKYYLRKLLGPLVTWRRRRSVRLASDGEQV